MNPSDLAQKTCIPCQGGTPPLKPEIVQSLLSALSPGWHINPTGHLAKQLAFDNFMKPMALANQIATLAEQEGHHPDLTIAWGRCAVEIWTHKINGLTESDFILAAKIDNLR